MRDPADGGELRTLRLLRGLGLFAPLPEEAVAAVGRAARTRLVDRGEVVIEEGAPSDTLLLVLSGRFEVRVEGSADPVNEIGTGELVGEIGFFSGQPRTATVSAIRDSVVLELDQMGFSRVAAAHPVVRETVLAALAHRLADMTRLVGPRPRSRAVRTVALVAAGDGSVPPAFLEALNRRISGRGGCIVSFGDIGGRAIDDDLTERLNALEQDYALIVYRADAGPSAWISKALHQADEVVVVASGDRPVPPSAVEREAYAIFPPARRRLVRLHEHRRGYLSGTAAWLDGRDPAMVHQVALVDGRDVASLHRFLTGRAVGLVAGGGGGFGPAQIGIVRAFQEAGVEFDIFGGTSFGAAAAASFAFGASPDDIVESIEAIFVAARSFSRRTFPRYALLDHGTFDRVLRERYLGLLMEDAWRPVFVVATDLSESRPAILREGPVWRAVRASVAIPAVLPPMVTDDGRLLVDGGVIDNIPLAPMKQMKEGPNLVVHFGLDKRRRYPVRYEDIPGRWRLIASLLLPGSRRRLPALPSPVTVIQTALTFRQPAAAAFGPADLSLSPPPFPGSSFLDFSRHREVTEAGYRWGLEAIRQLREDDDPAFAAIMGCLS